MLFSYSFLSSEICVVFCTNVLIGPSYLFLSHFSSGVVSVQYESVFLDFGKESSQINIHDFTCKNAFNTYFLSPVSPMNVKTLEMQYTQHMYNKIFTFWCLITTYHCLLKNHNSEIINHSINKKEMHRDNYRHVIVFLRTGERSKCSNSHDVVFGGMTSCSVLLRWHGFMIMVIK